MSWVVTQAGRARKPYQLWLNNLFLLPKTDFLIRGPSISGNYRPLQRLSDGGGLAETSKAVVKSQLPMSTSDYASRST